MVQVLQRSGSDSDPPRGVSPSPARTSLTTTPTTSDPDALSVSDPTAEAAQHNEGVLLALDYSGMQDLAEGQAALSDSEMLGDVNPQVPHILFKATLG